MQPGKQFWLGFNIDNNDEPGGASMRFISWPPAFGIFMPKENGALATLEE